MPTGVHELFIDGVEDAIRNQLKLIRNGSDRLLSSHRRCAQLVLLKFIFKSTTLHLAQRRNMSQMLLFSIKMHDTLRL